ncbi:MAG: sigma-70 family polymerase sigma factor [Candidatus Eremiobacteraeota bacterium]|jgi:RNA polymerase sigma-70 factor (ECF subfamily)|nr:sigma-70 family polymerase sigma factor [Candidatus Eremiobacteraeota bacterium]
MAIACAIGPPDRDELLAGALARDLDAAFERLVIAYRARIVTFVARMLRDDARAEDVAQDVFVRAYHALQTYPPERRAALRLRSWLYAIAHNLTRNTFRDAPPPSDPLDYDDGTPRVAVLDPQPDPETLVLREEAWASVGVAISELSPALRPAFVLRYVDELSYDEIAQTLEQPVGTVKASAHRGLLAVRAHLEKNDA